MKDNVKEGKKGEKLALKYIKSKGYQIISTNKYTPYGEIDIIAKDENIIIFIEVKLRNSKSFGHILEQISNKKKQCIINSAEFYLQTINKETIIRFDYIGLEYVNKNYKIHHIKDIIEL